MLHDQLIKTWDTFLLLIVYKVMSMVDFLQLVHAMSTDC